MHRNFVISLNKIYTLLFLLMLGSCHNFSNRISEAELECGTADTKLDSFAFIKLVTEMGPAVDSVPASDIKVQLVDLENKSPVMTLAITKKGCAILPSHRPRSSRMDVRVQNTTLAATRILSTLSDNHIGSLKLQPTRSEKYTLSCPQEGIFASRTFLNPLLITDAGSLETSQITLVAQPVENTGESTLLIKKDFGFELDNTNFGAEVSTDNLKEGTYYLRAITATLTEEFGLLPKFVNDEKSCILTVMKTPPVISSQLFSPKGFFIHKKDDDLPFKTNSDISAIQYCRQPYESKPGPSTSCEQIARECRDVDSFKPLKNGATAETGLFDYFFYATDRAGNRGQMQCQSIAVIDQPPAFSIDWPIAAWQQPNAYMKDAVFTIKPVITITDEQILPSNHVEQGLQCRAEFISQEGVTIQGSDVLCIRGKCAGKSLQDFVPCDRNFEISLAKVWRNTYANNSTLRLTVKSDAGIEPTVTLSKSINIQSKRWQAEKLPAPDVNWDQTIKLDQKSLLVSFRNSGTFLWKDEIWTKVFPSDIDADKLKNSKIIQDSIGSIYGFFETKLDNSQASKVDFFIYEDGNWEVLPNQPSFKECKLITARPDSGFTCIDSKADMLSFDGKAWSLNPAGPVSVEDPVFRALLYLNQDLFLATSRGIYVRDAENGAWQALFSVAKNDTTNIMQVQAFDGDIWVYLSDRLTGSMVRVEGSAPFEVSPVTIPKLNNASLVLGRAFEISETNQLYFFSYRWDSNQKAWQKQENIPEDLPGYDMKFERDLDGSAWLKSSLGFVNAKQGLFYPTANQGIDPSRALLTNEQGDFYFLGIPVEAEILQFYKISRKNYVILNQETSRLSLETFPDAWITSDGRISTVAFRKGEILSLNNSSWKSAESFSNSTETGFEEKLLPLRDDGIILKTAAGLLIKRKGTSWNYILKRGDKLQKLLPLADPEDIVNTDILKRISLVGEMPDFTIVLGISPKAGQLPLSDLVLIKQNGELISKTTMSLTKLSIVQNAVIAKEGILLTGKVQVAGEAQPITLFALLNSNLELIQKSTRDVSNRYLELMNELAPGFTGETFIGGFFLQASARSAVCSYRSLPDDVSTGRFVCLELITSPSISFGKPIAMPSEAQIKRARKSYQNYEPTRFSQLIEGKTSSLFVFSGEAFTTPTLTESSDWTTRASREQIVTDLGTEALVQSVFQDQNDRFILGIRNAGILVFD
jgi:hypothetical protein